MTKRAFTALLAVVAGLMACEKDVSVGEKTGYTIKVMAEQSSGKVSAITLNSGYATVTEVELENEDDVDSLEVEVDIEGNFRFDLITGISAPSFPVAYVPAGIYDELEVKLGRDDDPHIDALHLEATFTDTAGGISTPIEIDLEEKIDIEIEDEDGIDIQPNQINNLVVSLDIVAILEAYDWSDATVTNGVIIVDSQNNVDIYQQLIAMLSIEIKVED